MVVAAGPNVVAWHLSPRSCSSPHKSLVVADPKRPSTRAAWGWGANWASGELEFDVDDEASAQASADEAVGLATA